VTLGAACAACPLRHRCTTAKDGRSMTIHPHDGLLRAARAQARTAEFRRAYQTRSMIERIIAWTATQKGAGSGSATSGPPGRRLAAQPVRRAELADPDQHRPDTQRRALDPGLTRSAQTPPAPGARRSVLRHARQASPCRRRRRQLKTEGCRADTGSDADDKTEQGQPSRRRCSGRS
jgi:hypothetical protein